MSTDEWHIIALSLKAASLTTLLVLPAAIALAWILARVKLPGKAIIEALITLPMVAPPVVTGYLLLLLFGRNGLLGAWLEQNLDWQLSFNFAAIVLASFVVSLPLAVRSMKAAFELIDPAFEQASLTLGKNPFRTFMRINLPMAFPGLISAMVLSFARSLGEFGATITLAGNIPGKTQTLSTMVYTYMQVPGMERQVTRLVFISILISLLAISFSEFLNRRQAYLKKT